MHNLFYLCGEFCIFEEKNDAAHEAIDHFVRNFAKFFTDFKNSFTSKLNNKCVVKQHITP